MSYILEFLPEVEDDVIAGYIWYETKSHGLGEDFLRIFYTAAKEIQWNPLLYPKVYQDFRRCLIRRFPYAAYYTIQNEQIIVFGVFHCARHPRAVQAALKKREK
jgi:toxin ParE1/3/4